jgi:hypothetical protein
MFENYEHSIFNSSLILWKYIISSSLSLHVKVVGCNIATFMKVSEGNTKITVVIAKMQCTPVTTFTTWQIWTDGHRVLTSNLYLPRKDEFEVLLYRDVRLPPAAPSRNAYKSKVQKVNLRTYTLKGTSPTLCHRCRLTFHPPPPPPQIGYTIS